MIKQKAEETVKDFIKEVFSALKGWLYRFRKRYNLKLKTLHGESGSVNDAVWDEWIEETLHPIQSTEYKPSNIFYCNKTSLQYRAMPKRTIAKKTKNYTNIK